MESPAKENRPRMNRERCLVLRTCYQVVRTCGLTMTVPGGAAVAGGAAGAAVAAGMPGLTAALATAGGLAAAVRWMAASACLLRWRQFRGRLASQGPQQDAENDKGEPRQDEPDHPELLGAREFVIAGEIPDEGPHIDQHAGGDVGQSHLGPKRGLRENRHRDTPFQGRWARDRWSRLKSCACSVPKVTSASSGTR